MEFLGTPVLSPKELAIIDARKMAQRKRAVRWYAKTAIPRHQKENYGAKVPHDIYIIGSVDPWFTDDTNEQIGWVVYPYLRKTTNIRVGSRVASFLKEKEFILGDALRFAEADFMTPVRGDILHAIRVKGAGRLSVRLIKPDVHHGDKVNALRAASDHLTRY